MDHLSTQEKNWVMAQDQKVRAINPSAVLVWHDGTLLIKHGLYVDYLDFETGDRCALWLGHVDARTAVNLQDFIGEQMRERGLYGKKG